jgi:DNA-binding NtrC family response regulator
MLPALRERGDDILMIASNFIQEFNSKFGKNITGFSPDAAKILSSYPWKGNIRELRNVIERVILLGTEDIISKDSLSFLKSSTIANVPGANASIEIKDGQHYLKVSKVGAQMAFVLKDLIIQVLKITGGNQIKAAKLLGISRAKLRYRIEQLSINISGKNIS